MNNNQIWGNNNKENEDLITVIDNDIYFYASINKKTAFSLNTKIKALEKDLYYRAVVDTALPTHINIHISSFGGVVLDAFSIVDTIRNCKVPVYTTVEGMAASAATLVSLMGKKRYIGKNSYMMIHQLSGVATGNYEYLKVEMKNTKQLMDHIKKIYLENTNLNIEELNEILKHDYDLNADMCIKLGLVDGVI